MTVLGTITPDFFGALLQTGYDRFESPTGICGLARVRPPRLDLLALDTETPGRGQFRQFITQAKAEFETICVWAVWNPWLSAVLERYGFKEEIETQGDGEVLHGFRWDLSKHNSENLA